MYDLVYDDLGSDIEQDGSPIEDPTPEELKEFWDWVASTEDQYPEIPF